MNQESVRTVGEVIRSLTERAPLNTAEGWDNVGLLVGDPTSNTHGAVVSIDLTTEAIDMAIQANYKLIINHHPCIFPKNRGLSQIEAGTPVYRAIQNGISVAAYHTNFDQSALEVVNAVSSGLKIKPKGRLIEKFEVAAEQSGSSQQSSNIVAGIGYGFWGDFLSKRPFSDVAKDVKELFNIHAFWITNPIPSFVSRVGFVAGKGASFLDAAAAAGCDLFITGETGYHPALGSSRKGVSVMELGHRESEKFFVDVMKGWLSDLGLHVAHVQTPTQTIWSGGI